MKKLKMMLLSLALLAIVAGALAFKAIFYDDICVTKAKQNAHGAWTCIDPTDPLSHNLFCPDLVHSSITVGEAFATTYCTTPSFNGGCLNIRCETPTKSLT